MDIENVKIEDAADANYVIRKFFKDQFKDIKMSQLEHLVLTVYNMGRDSGAAANAGAGSGPGEVEAPSAEEAAVDQANVNPFKVNDRARAIEDIEIGHTGVFITANTEGTISSVKEDIITFMFESGDEGEIIETSVSFDKLEKV